MKRNKDNRYVEGSRHRQARGVIRLVEREPEGGGFQENERGAGKSRSRPAPRRRANRRGGRGGFIALMVAALAAALVCTAQSPRFSIRSIAVQGTHVVPASVIEKFAGVHPGDNLLMVSTRGVRRRLLEIPAIADAHLERRFPNSLVIVVKERRPWAAALTGQRIYLLDREWRVIDQVKCVPPRLPQVIIKAPVVGEIPAPGRVISHGSLAAALGCLRESQDPELNIPITRIFIDAKRNIWLNVGDIGRVNLGLAYRLGAKLATLRTIYRHSPQLLQNAQCLDLQNADAPAYSPRHAPATAAGA
ncbi:MAG TPA: FtsQ-type POTRA domain-containing protein [Armatimonadota bacterium]|nr:FtsQ-type POTRA domain-containing protein [Armatimonadota bacterium]